MQLKAERADGGRTGGRRGPVATKGFLPRSRVAGGRRQQLPSGGVGQTTKTPSRARACFHNGVAQSEREDQNEREHCVKMRSVAYRARGGRRGEIIYRPSCLRAIVVVPSPGRGVHLVSSALSMARNQRVFVPTRATGARTAFTSSPDPPRRFGCAGRSTGGRSRVSPLALRVPRRSVAALSS